MASRIDPNSFRQVMGQYPTGVVVITATAADGSPVGMVVGSFTSVSLDPCMVAFLPDRNARSWKALRESGSSFGVNVLAADQEWICRQVAVRKQDKFEGVAWRKSPGGNPLIDGCVAFLDCETDAIHEAGDHDIVVGEVVGASVHRPANSLLFYQGGYGSFRPRSLAAGAAGLHEQLRFIDLARPIMDRLAAHTHCEVIALALAEGDLVTAASSGRHKQFEGWTRVGHRVPFVPPVGALHAAWSGERTRKYWLDQIPPDAPPSRRDHYERMLELIKLRGYGFTLGHGVGSAIEHASAQHSQGTNRISEDELRQVIFAAHSAYNPTDLDPDGDYEFHAATVPVFHPGGDLAFTLTLWGPDGEISYDAMNDLIDTLVSAGRSATQALAFAEGDAEWAQ